MKFGNKFIGKILKTMSVATLALSVASPSWVAAWTFEPTDNLTYRLVSGDVDTVTTEYVPIYYKTSNYSEEDPLYAATRFHVFAYEDIQLNAHTNGNVATNYMSLANSNSGTSGLDTEKYVSEVSYVQDFRSINAQILCNQDSPLIVGSAVKVDTYDNGNGFTLQGSTMTSSREMDRGKVRNIFQEVEGGVSYIDLDGEFNKLRTLSKNLSTLVATDNATYNNTDFNNRTIKVDMSAQKATVVNMPAYELSMNTPIKLVGYDVNGDNSVIINVDLKDYSSGSFDVNSPIKYIDVAENEIGNRERTSWEYGKVLWNFYDSSAADGCYSGSISVNAVFLGSVLVPNGDIKFNQNFDGTAICKTFANYAETHRNDFTGYIPGFAVVEDTTDSTSTSESTTETTTVSTTTTEATTESSTATTTEATTESSTATTTEATTESSTAAEETDTTEETTTTKEESSETTSVTETTTVSGDNNEEDSSKSEESTSETTSVEDSGSTSTTEETEVSETSTETTTEEESSTEEDKTTEETTLEDVTTSGQATTVVTTEETTEVTTEADTETTTVEEGGMGDKPGYGTVTEVTTATEDITKEDVTEATTDEAEDKTTESATQDVTTETTTKDNGGSGSEGGGIQIVTVAETTTEATTEAQNDGTTEAVTEGATEVTTDEAAGDVTSEATTVDVETSTETTTRRTTSGGGGSSSGGSGGSSSSIGGGSSSNKADVTKEDSTEVTTGDEDEDTGKIGIGPTDDDNSASSDGTATYPATVPVDGEEESVPDQIGVIGVDDDNASSDSNAPSATQGAAGDGTGTAGSNSAVTTVGSETGTGATVGSETGIVSTSDATSDADLTYVANEDPAGNTASIQAEGTQAQDGTLPQTGSVVNTKALCAVGVFAILLGGFLVFKSRKRSA